MLAGLDHRFGWSSIHTAVEIAVDVLVLLSYALFARVLLENCYASRVLEVQQAQRVIDTGPYSLVRHPMYVARHLRRHAHRARLLVGHPPWCCRRSR